MKRRVASILTVFMPLLANSAAYAASGAGEDNIGFFAWLFLAMCALILVGQLLPAILLMFGFARSFKKEGEKAKTEG